MNTFFFIVFLAYKGRNEVLDTYLWMKHSPSCWILISFFFFIAAFQRCLFLVSQNGLLPYVNDGIDTRKIYKFELQLYFWIFQFLLVLIPRLKKSMVGTSLTVQCLRLSFPSQGVWVWSLVDFPGVLDGKASVYNAGYPGSIPGLGRSLGEGNGNPLQDYCLKNPMDRGAW